MLHFVTIYMIFSKWQFLLGVSVFPIDSEDNIFTQISNSIALVVKKNWCWFFLTTYILLARMEKMERNCWLNYLKNENDNLTRANVKDHHPVVKANFPSNKTLTVNHVCCYAVSGSAWESITV
jgi:hypothetical protein